MFNHHNGVAGIAQLVQHFEQQGNVGKVQTCGGLIQDVERAAGIALGQLQCQLHTLCLTARQGGGRLAQADVAQAHIEQCLQLARNGGHSAEEFMGCFNRHVEHLRNVLALVQNFQGFAVVALAVAHITRHIHIGQEVHFHFDHAVALASFASTATIGGIDVEAETAWAITTLTGSRDFGHQVANVREQTGVSGGVAAGCATNR